MNIGKQAGFTLVEVMIASAIVVISMGVILQLFGSGLDRMHRAGNAEHMILVKRQVFDDIRMSNPAGKGKSSGVVEGVLYQWVATPYGLSQFLSGSETLANTKVQMYRIVVSFPGGGGEPFEVLQLGYRYEVR